MKKKRVLIVGSGGREHALAWKLLQSPVVEKIFCAPGNGGTSQCATNVPIEVTEIDQLKNWAKENAIDLTVVGPEVPLSLGIVDEFSAAGLAIFGVNQSASRLESSKVFSKQILQKYDIPAAKGASFSDLDKARSFLATTHYPVVIKVDGLAAGKGVFICQNQQEAESALTASLEKGAVLIEEFLDGEELSYIALLNGDSFLPLAASQDHKRAFDGDQGPNTGGMGAYSPVPWFDETWEEKINKEIMKPLMSALATEGIQFQGVLYVGLMVVEAKPYVLEFNVRFGDPEVQAILYRLKDDLYPLLDAVAHKKTLPKSISWDPRPAVCVVMASGGYPGAYRKGEEIHGLPEAEQVPNVALFHAGTVLKGGRVLTAGGRVLNVVATGESYEDALNQAYKACRRIEWKGAFYRKDIAYRACQKNQK